MKLSAQFDYETVDHEKDNTVHLLLTVEAPAIDWVSRRPRICILPVVDVSGSMQGRKLEYAKQACRKLVEQLKVGDYSGLITFNSQVCTMVKPGPVTPELKTRLLKAIDELWASAGTNFSDSIVSSLAKIGDLDLPPNVLQRAIFFTDGQPTSGVTDATSIKGLVAKHVGSHSMSFFGYGEGTTCDQDLLTELSQLGKGNYAYVQNADDALAAFGRELGGLLSTYASDLRLVIEPRNGHTVEKVVTLLGPDKAPAAGVTGVTSVAEITEVTIEVGDILAEETRHIVLECSVKKQDKALPRDFTLFNVKATCRRITQEGEKASEEATAAAKMRFVSPDEAQKAPTPTVDEIVSLHQLAVVQREAEADANRGDYRVAQSKLADFSRGLQLKGLVAEAHVASNMADFMGNAASYTGSRGYLKSMGQGILRSAGVASYDSVAQVELQNMKATCNGAFGNSAQAAYSTAFTSESTSEPLVGPNPATNVVIPTPATKDPSVEVEPAASGK
jgi:Ca-activated chloride channel family protein